MATRLYYRGDRFYPIPDAYRTMWDRTAVFEPFVYGLETTPFERALAATTTNRGPASGVSGDDAAWAVFYTRPLIAQTISGTLKGRMAANEVSTAHNYTAQLKAYIVGPDGAVKSTLYGGYSGALVSEFATAKANREFPKGSSVSLTTQTAAAGDRIMVMVGARIYAAGGGQGNLYYFDMTGSDLPENETATSGTPWLEFSANLTFLSDVTLMEFQEFVAEDEAIWKLGAGGGGGSTVPTSGQIWPRGNR